MKIVYFANFINHHQANVSDCLYEMTEHNYTFVELCPIYDWLLKSGYSDLSSKPYVLQAWKSKDNMDKALRLIDVADVFLYAGPEAQSIAKKCAITGKLCFEVGERSFKKGWLNLLSPNLQKHIWNYFSVYRKYNVYRLCASAYSARDLYTLNMYREKYYKWGYFTTVDDHLNVETSLDVSTSEITPLMWCSRFLKLKHPELPILMAKKLKDKGFHFHLDMFGSGEKLEVSKQLVEDLKLNDVITFRGNVPNASILQEMRKHEIFLFTSDQNEGWGAVSNESMASGCVLVGADMIGSVPFLVEDGKTGLIFRSADKTTGFNGTSLKIDNNALASLTQKVEWLLNNPKERNRLSKNGYNVMRKVWSPENAAKNLLILINDLQNGRDTSIQHGPCSIALPI